MLNKLYKNLLIIAGLAILVTSCSKDFLEVSSYGKSDATKFYSTEEEISLGLYAAYDMLSADQLQGWSSPFFMKNLPSDDSNCGGGGSGDQAQYQDIDDFKWQPSNQGFNAYYSIYYFGVYRCNQVINNAKISTSAANIMIAEAKFLRAYYFFELTTAFGDVPLRIANAEALTASMARTPQKDVYAQIAKDLTEAIAVLPNKSTYKEKDGAKNANMFRASKQAAQALLGKMYLYAGNFAMAKTALEAVIATEGTEVKLTTKFADILLKSQEFNDESLLEGSFVNEGKNWGNASWNRNAEDNRHLQLQGPRDFSDDNNILGYGLRGGWGFNTPTAKLYNSLDPTDPRRALTAFDFKAKFKQIAAQTEIEAIANATTLKLTLTKYLKDTLKIKEDIVIGGVVNDVFVANSGTTESKYNLLLSIVVNKLKKLSYNTDGWDQEGMVRIKYGNFVSETTDASGATPELNFTTNWRLIRYADVLLMAAEANFKLGNTAEALVQINKVRARAGATLLTTLTMDNIVKERQIELAFEGSRFWDLVRWGMAETELGSLGFKKGKHEHFPIPLDEMNANTLIGSQNPGY